MDEESKYKAYGLIAAEKAPREISEQLGVSYAAVLRMQREYKTHRENDTLAALLDIDKLLIQEVSSAIDLPEEGKELVAKMDNLSVLAGDFQRTATMINNKARSMIASCDHASELETITDILCALNTAFVAPKTTQVNVQNNNISPEAAVSYKAFLGDAPGE